MKHFITLFLTLFTVSCFGLTASAESNVITENAESPFSYENEANATVEKIPFTYGSEESPTSTQPISEKVRSLINQIAYNNISITTRDVQSVTAEEIANQFKYCGKEDQQISLEEFEGKVFLKFKREDNNYLIYKFEDGFVHKKPIKNLLTTFSVENSNYMAEIYEATDGTINVSETAYFDFSNIVTEENSKNIIDKIRGMFLMDYESIQVIETGKNVEVYMRQRNNLGTSFIFNAISPTESYLTVRYFTDENNVVYEIFVTEDGYINIKPIN